MSDNDLGFWVVVWAATALYLLVRHWRNGSGVGLLLTYVLSFGSIHWLAATLHLLPWFVNRRSDTVADGMHQAAIAMLALAAGAEVTALVMRRLERARVADAPETTEASGLDPRALRFLLFAGVGVYAFLAPVGSKIPGLQALVATGSSIIVLAVALFVWNGWRTQQWWSMRRWLAATLVLPFVSVVSQGFLGAGMAATLAVFAFTASFFRPRWKVVAFAMVFGYLGLSVYITYMRDRNDIRQVVWGGSDLSARAHQITDTFAGMEWFDVYDQAHLYRVDSRLNQDFLVGAAVQRLDRGFVPFANGSTFVDAALSLVPRALWPNKPVVAGSGSLMAEYTGFRFSEGTSVGIGEVLECYINFGTAGIVGGFLAMGMLLVLVDRSAASALAAGDVFRLARWYLPGLGLLQVGGSLPEVVSTCGAGFVVALLLREAAVRFLRVAPATRAAHESLTTVPDANQ